MSFTNLLVTREGPVAVVTLNRPQRRNALSLELMRDLIRSEKFTDFLTLPAYEQVLREETFA